MTEVQSNRGNFGGKGLMRAMRIHHVGVLDDNYSGLVLDLIPVPVVAAGEILIKVDYCGVCHTELDEIEGRATPEFFPMTPGHQVVGTVIEQGVGCSLDLLGTTVGIAWIHSACGDCAFCQSGKENLCPHFSACGMHHDGGYAEYMTAHEAFAHPIPDEIDATQAAPLLCAGAVGYRSLKMTELSNGKTLGLTGFGASGQLVLKMARLLYPDSRVYVFARSEIERKRALDLGAAWAGDTLATPPAPLSAIIDTTPAWTPVLAALEQLEPGGKLVINAIRKEHHDQATLQDLDYARHLWLEKSIQSVANVTRSDVREMLQLAARYPLTSRVSEFPLEEALQALLSIRQGHISQPCVLWINPANQ